MSSPSAVTAFLAAALGLAACEQTNGNYCCTDLATCHLPGGSPDLVPCTDPTRPFCDNAGEFGLARTCIPDPGTTACDGSEDCTSLVAPVCDAEGTGTCVGCDDAADCSRFAGTTECDATTGTCVECIDAGDCTNANEPVCGADRACRACVNDSECDSGICDESTGACVDESLIVYVATGGSGSACTRAQPCGTIATGIAAVTVTRKNILVAAGSYTETLVVSGRSLTIVGAGAELQPTALNQVPISVSNMSDVSIEGLRITGAGGAANPEGINCQGQAGNPSTLVLVGATVNNNGGVGIITNRCNLTVVQSHILGNNGGGLNATDGVVTIRNNFFAGNGGALTNVGGVRLDSSGAGSVFEFNTVANNVSSAGFASGLICSSVATHTFSNNIVVGQSADQVSGTNCNFTYTLSDEALAGTGNTTMQPMFVNVATNDYHLAAGSAGIDAADPAATLATDIDGDTRPQNGRADIGADEAQ